MANKRISELSSRTPSATDLMLVGDPTTGYSYKCLVSQVGGVTSVFGRTGAVTAQEGDYSLTLLSDVTITAPTVDQVLIYNGTTWVNAENYSNKTQHLVKLGAAIGKGKAVYVSGASGTNMIVNLSSNDNEATSSKVLGLTASAGALNDMVYVITEGLLPGIDTSGSTAGDPVWLGTNGNLIFGGANRPVPPLNAVYLGVVTRVSATVGEVFIRVQNGFELEELHDVKFTSLANNHALVYNSTSQLWENKALSTTNVTEGTNLYYTDARARGAISLTTTGSGAATYNSSTGVLNIPTPSSVNLYNSDGTLTGNRTVTMGGNSLIFSGGPISLSGTISGQATSLMINNTINATANNQTLAALDISPTFTSGAFTGVTFIGFRVSTNGQMLFNTNSGTPTVDIGDGSTNINATLRIRRSSTSTTSNLFFVTGSTNTAGIRLLDTTNNLSIFNSSASITMFGGGNMGINTTTDAGFRLDVNGTARVQGAVTLTSSLTMNGLLNNSSAEGRFNNIGTGGAAADANYGLNAGGGRGIRIASGGQTALDMVNVSGKTFGIRTQTTSLNTGGGLAFANITDDRAFLTMDLISNVALISDNTPFAGTITLNPSSILTISSTTKGVLLPRMTTAQRNAIASPATGLMVYDTTGNTLDVYNGTQWLDVLASDFITIDNTNNRLGINTASPTYDLHVTGTGAVTGSLDLATAGSTRVTIGNQSDTSYKLSVDGDLRVYGNIRTAQPTGGTGVGVWRLGSTATGTFTLDTALCVEIEIGGTLYRLATVDPA